jgi:hypothetical protein
MSPGTNGIPEGQRCVRHTTNGSPVPAQGPQITLSGSCARCGAPLARTKAGTVKRTPRFCQPACRLRELRDRRAKARRDLVDALTAIRETRKLLSGKAPPTLRCSHLRGSLARIGRTPHARDGSCSRVPPRQVISAYSEISTASSGRLVDRPRGQLTGPRAARDRAVSLYCAPSRRTLVTRSRVGGAAR